MTLAGIRSLQIENLNNLVILQLDPFCMGQIALSRPQSGTGAEFPPWDANRALSLPNS